MFHIIYTGHSLPSCDNEYGITRDTVKHAQTHELLHNILVAENSGFAQTNITDDTKRTILQFSGLSVEQQKNLLEKLKITIVAHGSVYHDLKVITDVWAKQNGCIGCSQPIHHFGWPSDEAWLQALTTGWKTKSFTMYVEVR